MAFKMSKTGNGAFSVEVQDDGKTIANGKTFDSAQQAYDFYRESAGRGSNVAWNTCYALEDVLQA